MTRHAVSTCLLSVASLLATPLALRAETPAADHAPRYELFSSVTGRWAKVNDLDPLKPMTGDKVIVAVSATESFEVVLASVEEAPRGVRISWSGAVTNEAGSRFAVGFTRATGDDKAHFAGGTLEVPSRHRLFTFKVEKERPGWTLVSEHEPGSGAGTPQQPAN